jgi:5-methylcytosine-specific restriction endonuclease McrA
MAAYRKANKERIAKDKARYVAENRDSVAAQKARWAAENRDRTLSNVKRWKSENKSRVLASNAKRRAAQLQRTPSWANDQLIAAYYKEAKRLEELTGIEFHVDHIIPLQGELVSGLHVETNLQLLTQHDNLRKGNHYG